MFKKVFHLTFWPALPFGGGFASVTELRILAAVQVGKDGNQIL